MEAPGHNDPGYDDWFDEPEPPTETQSGANRGVYEETAADEVWVLPEEEDSGSGGQRTFDIAGRTLTMTQVAIIGLCLLALLLAILAAFGVFNGSKAAVPPVAPTHPVTTTPQNTTPANTTPSVQAPTQTPLKSGDTGAEVKQLQKALAAAGFSPGTPDGDYGPSTMNAVERFQIAKKLGEDGIYGPATAAALQKALSG
jgi:hypothetical protein